VFVRVTLYYFGCMFVASSLNHFWFWFWLYLLSKLQFSTSINQSINLFTEKQFN